MNRSIRKYRFFRSGCPCWDYEKLLYLCCILCMCTSPDHVAQRKGEGGDKEASQILVQLKAKRRGGCPGVGERDCYSNIRTKS